MQGRTPLRRSSAARLYFLSWSVVHSTFPIVARTSDPNQRRRCCSGRSRWSCPPVWWESRASRCWVASSCPCCSVSGYTGAVGVLVPYADRDQPVRGGQPGGQRGPGERPLARSRRPAGRCRPPDGSAHLLRSARRWLWRRRRSLRWRSLQPSWRSPMLATNAGAGTRQRRARIPSSPEGTDRDHPLDTRRRRRTPRTDGRAGRKVLFLGTHGQANIGDELLLDTFLTELGPDHHYFVNSYDPAATSEQLADRFDVAVFDTATDRLGLLRNLWRSDVVVFGGGNILKELYRSVGSLEVLDAGDGPRRGPSGPLAGQAGAHGEHRHRTRGEPPGSPAGPGDHLPGLAGVGSRRGVLRLLSWHRLPRAQGPARPGCGVGPRLPVHSGQRSRISPEAATAACCGSR